MTSFISSFENINVVISDLKVFFWIASSVAVAALNANGIKILLANDAACFSNASKSLPRNVPHCPFLCNSIFDNFILADKLFAKVLQSLRNCVND